MIGSSILSEFFPKTSSKTRPVRPFPHDIIIISNTSPPPASYPDHLLAVHHPGEEEAVGLQAGDGGQVAALAALVSVASRTLHFAVRSRQAHPHTSNQYAFRGRDITVIIDISSLDNIRSVVLARFPGLIPCFRFLDILEAAVLWLEVCPDVAVSGILVTFSSFIATCTYTTVTVQCSARH